VASLRDERSISRLLDVIDGAEAKDAEVLAVMTTNHIEKIPAGMMRPGRFDRVIEIGAMDRPGVEKLARLVCRDGLAADVDFDAVFAATDGYMPAFVREGLEGAVRYSISRNQAIKDISTIDLVHSLNSLRTQHTMLLAAMGYKLELPPIDQLFREMIGETVSENLSAPDIDYGEIHSVVDSVIERRINGATLYDRDGDEMGNLNTN
jgi:SpoVK/Ycf46/Vps4 family AAA+-type ATPase